MVNLQILFPGVFAFDVNSIFSPSRSITLENIKYDSTLSQFIHTPIYFFGFKLNQCNCPWI